MTDTLLTDYLTPAELAVELGVCARTIERWHRLREAPPRTRVGKRILYRRAAVKEWLNAREQEVEAE